MGLGSSKAFMELKIDWSQDRSRYTSVVEQRGDRNGDKRKEGTASCLPDSGT